MNTSIPYVDKLHTSRIHVDLAEIFRLMAFDPSKPYNDLPPLPPQANIETRAVLKACIGARAALAELKQAGELIPNQAVLLNSIPSVIRGRRHERPDHLHL